MHAANRGPMPRSLVQMMDPEFAATIGADGRVVPRVGGVREAGEALIGRSEKLHGGDFRRPAI